MTRPVFACALFLVSAALFMACSSSPVANGSEDAVDDTVEDTTGASDGRTDTNVTPIDAADGAADADGSGPPTDAGGDAVDGSGASAGGAGIPCREGVDCLSTICLFFDPSADEGFCSDACVDASDCPAGWGCVTFTDTGEDAVRRCIAPDLCVDRDDDGYGEGPGCTGRDCDDSRPDINPAADEVCNGIDDDCDTRIDDNPLDERRSCETGFVGRCGAGQTVCDGGLLDCRATAAAGSDVCDGIDNDCDGTSDEDDVCLGEACCYLERCEGVCDTARRSGDGTCLAPGGYAVAELCDGLDNDCDGEVDEGVLASWYADADEDGFGDPEVSQQSCAAPVGYVANDEDCDDDADAVNPDATETCDEVDNDCDGDVDTGVCAGLNCCWNDTCVGVCATAQTGADGLCARPAAAGAEVCDSLDNDCDGSIDEGVQSLFYRDADNDGYGGGTELVACAGPSGWVDNGDDCDDGARTTYPGAPELCNGQDDDCDELADEGSPGAGLVCSTGSAGVCSGGTTVCEAGAPRCVPAAVSSPEVCDGLDNDCDGQLDEGNPGAGGVCDTGLQGLCGQGVSVCTGGAISCLQVVAPLSEVCDGRDNDCDGDTDEGGPGSGAACVTGALGACSIGATECTGGTLLCAPRVAATSEICDGQDNDCDGQVDEGNPGGGTSCSTGAQGVCAAGVLTCTSGGLVCQPTGFATTETCDELDNDCDGQVDEGNPGGGGSCSTGLQGACGVGSLTCSAGALRCNQTVFSSTEVCDGIDNDCNGIADNGNPGGGTSCSTGRPAPCGSGQTACVGGGLVCQQTGFGSAEVCDGVDNDCDGTVDEATTCSTCVQRNNGDRSYLFCGRRFREWTEARDACAALGYRLATVNDATENAWLQSTLRTAIPGGCANTCVWADDNVCDDGGTNATWTECDYGTDCRDCGSRSYPATAWIGSNDRTTEGTFTWVSGITSTFTSWAGGEPNNSSGDEDCAELRGADGLWNDVRCNRDRAFICESL